MKAKDNFSAQAAAYSKYRPAYPEALFKAILDYVPHRNMAWDCATGNGQAAIALAGYFDCVEATDLSEKQIALATPHPRIRYSVAPAENSGFANDSFDLITVAQAFHWIANDDFFAEVNRVGKKGSIVAVWCYGLVQSNNSQLNKLIRIFYKQTVGPYWDKERAYIDEELKTIPFPFEGLPAPNELVIEKTWGREDFLGYLDTWSSVQHYIRANGRNPVEAFAAELSSAWPEPVSLSFHFPLYIRIGRINKTP